jgi:predicted Zn-dependent protease
MLSATAMGDTSSGWVLGIAPGPEGLDVDRLAATAVEKALASRDPRPIPAGRYTVILEPAPVASLVEFLLPGFNARAFHEGRSFLGGEFPKRVANEAFSLADDHAHPLHDGKPFDEEGVARRRVLLVDRGVARALVWDRRTAAARGAEPTGHGLRLPNAEGAAPAHPVVPGGAESVEDLIRSTRRGILVTRLWYVRLVDPMRVIVTGMTRDGTFWIEDGRIAHGVRNLRVNESVVDAFGRISGVARETLTASSERAVAMVVPALRIEDFQFTSEASF